MAKLRKIQFYRNGSVQEITNEGVDIDDKTYLVEDLKSAYVYAEALFKQTEQHKNMLDGEILLYRFSYNGQVHTLVGVVHADGTETTSNRSLEVLANYDMLGVEISAAIAKLDGSATIATVANGVVTLKAGVKQVDGIVSQGTDDIVLAKVATSGKAEDVNINTAITGLDATTVQDALAELQGDITALQAIDPVVTTVVEGTGIKVTDTVTGNDHAYTVAADFTVDTHKYPTDSTAAGYDADKAGKTYIRIMDGETVISETDAAAFVKDGFLESVTKDAEKNELVFTWNTDAGVQETTISIKDLCDVYTVGEGLVASEDGYTFSHQAGATGLTAGTAFGSGSVSNNGNKITVKVPSVTVDKFGHVSALTETEVSLEIPAAVQAVIGDTYVSATKTDTDVKLATKTKTVADATADTDGLATAHSVKTYVDGKIADLDTPEGGVSSAETNNVKVTVTQVDGIVNTVTVVDNSINATDLSNAINALDAEVTSADETNVQVKVTEVDGKITAVNVTDNSINATDLKTAIEALDADKSGSNVSQDITVQVVEKDGKIDEVKVSDTLKSVAHTGAAADVSIADTENVITATTVEGALVEIAKEIDAMNSAHTPGELIKVNFTQVDGKVTAFTTDETALKERLEAIEGKTITGENAIDVTSNTTGNVVSLNLAEKTILTQDDNGLKATLSIVYNSNAKQIELHGVNGVIGEPIDATDFIKDGMLEDAEIITATNEEGLVAGKRYIKFTFKTYQQGQSGAETLKVEYLDVESLFDSYTAGNDWIVIDQDANTISHKTVNSLDSTNAHGITTDVTVDSTETKTFKVPTLTVDAAGHVVSVDEKTVTITLPESIDTAIQGGAGVDTTYITTTVARNATNTNQLDVTATAQIGSVANDTAGLAEATEVKDYVDSKIDALDESTTIIAEEGIGIRVTDDPGGGSNDHKYTVNLAEAPATVTNNTDNYVAANRTHTRISDITVDKYGRVTAVIKTTVTEDFDAGTY